MFCFLECSVKGNKRNKKSVKKDSQLVIRLSAEQRDEFIALCEELDTSAAREIRRFMKRFVAEHKNESSDD
jgi:hypothetical protein